MEMEWAVEMATRLVIEWTKGGKLNQALEAESAVILERFLDANQQSIDHAAQRYRQWISSFTNAVTQFAAELETKTASEEVVFILDTLDKLLDTVSVEQITKALETFSDITETELGQAIKRIKTEVLIPFLDGLIAHLEAAYRQGTTTAEAFNCFMIASRIRQLRDMIEETNLDLPDLNVKALIEPLLKLLTSIRYEEIRLQAKFYLRQIRGLSNKIQCLSELRLSGQVENTRAVSARDAEPEPERILWYASWLLGADFRLQGSKVYRQELKHILVGNGDYRADLSNHILPGELRTLMTEAQVRLPANFNIKTIHFEKVWHLQEEGKDEILYSLLWDNNNVQVYKGEVYLTDDWSQIKPLQRYTFAKISPDTADKLVFHSAWVCHVIEAILHFASMEPTSEIPGNSDMFSNLINALNQLTYAGLRVSGTSGFGWRKKDFEPDFWLRWGIPLGATLLSSIEGVHTKENNPCCTRFIYWLTLAGADVSELLLYRHWIWLAEEALFSCVTLLNYEGDREHPANIFNPDREDDRPLNRKEVLGVALLFVELGIWIQVSQYPRNQYGIPNDENGDVWKTFFGHMFGVSLGIGLLSGFVGTVVAECIAWAEDWPVLAKTMFLYASWIPIVKFPFYLYLNKDGDTAGGTYLSAGDPATGYRDTYPFAGYPPKDSSPYRLPYPKGRVYQCAQGNMGLWSHTPHSFSFQIYSFDFTHDFNEPIAAARGGIVWNFTEDQTDGEDDQNIIRILHPTPSMAEEAHDFNSAKNVVRTFGIYVHGAKDSITAAFLQRGITIGWKAANDPLMNTAAVLAAFNAVGIDLTLYGGQSFPVELDASGNPRGPLLVNRGDVIMGAGDTGRSAYNHLHLNLQPAEVDSSTGKILGTAPYSIPFVFGDVDGNGVPKALNYYKSDNG